LTYFLWSKWAEIWYAYHVVDDVWSWIIWGFIEMFVTGFEWSLSVDFFEVLYDMFWPNLFVKW
jgi:hypothetical protein